jgi:hypothetical protein
MARAALFRLLDEPNSRGRNGCPHLIRLVTDHGVDVAWWHNLAGGGNHVTQQRLAANLVQDLGPVRFEPRPFTGRHNNYRPL